MVSWNREQEKELAKEKIREEIRREFTFRGIKRRSKK